MRSVFNNPISTTPLISILSAQLSADFHSRPVPQDRPSNKFLHPGLLCPYNSHELNIKLEFSLFQYSIYALKQCKC